MHETNTPLHGSILSFPDRGPWGNSRYRGNCSGYVYKRVFEHLRPRVFTDPMVGSGTSVEVAREMGIEAYGLDLHSGFNILKTSILEAVGKPSDPWELDDQLAIGMALDPEGSPTFKVRC